MKKSIFVLVSFLVLPLFSYGQYPSHVFYGSNVDLGLVRSCDAGKSIALHMEGNRYHLVKVDHNNYLTSATTPFYNPASTLSSYFTQMADMCVCNPYVFVCGTGKYGDGLIGYMRISDIGMPFPQFNFFNIGCVQKIHSMAVYFDGRFKVVAVGQDHSGYNHVVVQIDDAVGNYSFTCKEVNSEVLHEVRHSANHLVLIGYDLTRKAMCIRKAGLTQGINDPMIDTKYYYYTTDEDILSRTVSKFSLQDPDLLAVSYMGQDMLGNIISGIRYFDLPTMNMISRQYFVPGGKSAPQEMTFVESEKGFVLLQPFNFGGTYNSNFIFLRPDIIPYNARLLYYPGKEFGSLDRFSPRHYISCATRYVYFQDCSIRPIPYNQSCIQEDKIAIGTKSIIATASDPLILQLLPCLDSPDNGAEYQPRLQLNHDCNN